MATSTLRRTSAQARKPAKARLDSAKRGKSLSPASRALAHLKKVDSLLFKLSLPHHAELSKASEHRRKYTELFAALAGSIVSQQLSTKAADTIWGRLRAVCGGEVTADSIAKLRLPTMRKAGLSAAKAKSLKELSRAVRAGALDLKALKKVPEAEAVAKLSSVWGIGTWTAEMFLLFALGREDVFSPGDLGLRRSIESIYSLPKDAPIKELELIAAKWSPHRSFACRILWRVRDNGDVVVTQK